jgi:hypothetical protein
MLSTSIHRVEQANFANNSVQYYAAAIYGLSFNPHDRMSTTLVNLTSFYSLFSLVANFGRDSFGGSGAAGS